MQLRVTFEVVIKQRRSQIFKGGNVSDILDKIQLLDEEYIVDYNEI